MLRNVTFYLFTIFVVSVPLLLGLGNDMVSKDDFHFKNWSYVFMKEFEEGNYDRLYVSVQPGVLTIYSNIIGFKSLYYAKDKLGIVSAEGKSFELLLHFAQKLPKVLFIIGVCGLIAHILKNLMGKRFALIFMFLLALEPYVIGQSRVIQTDAIPMYLGFLTLLVLYQYRKSSDHNYYLPAILGLLTGLCILEKSLYFVLAFLIFCEFIYWGVATKEYKLYAKELLVFLVALCLTLVVLFPAFWGNFLFTFYRITVGSFVFGVQGLNTENFSYEKTPHVQSIFYYFRFLVNKISEVVWIGIVVAIVMVKSWREKVSKNNAILVSYPIFLFILLLVSQKKIGRYLVSLYPYIIFCATWGYYKFLNSRVKIWVFIAVVLIIKFFQFRYYFPDFLMYQNPLTIDRSFDNAAESWGSGRKKLANYLGNKYGNNMLIYSGDYTTLELFYPGIVLNKEDYICGEEFDLLITLNKEESVCGTKLTPSDSYSPYKGLVFYIYRKDFS